MQCKSGEIFPELSFAQKKMFALRKKLQSTKSDERMTFEENIFNLEQQAGRVCNEKKKRKTEVVMHGSLNMT
jgi:hypothetical protein